VVHILKSRRVWIAGFAALAILLSMVVLAASPKSSASAAANRRLCKYIEQVSTDVTVPKPGSTGDRYTIPATLYVSVNYKKDGKCPPIEDPYHIAGNDANVVRLTNEHPEPKDECEDWGRTIGATGAYRGTLSAEDPALALAPGPNPFLVDVCTTMAVDTIFEFYVFSTDISFGDGAEFKKGEFVSNRRYEV
jgi:hypothetical protein